MIMNEKRNEEENEEEREKEKGNTRRTSQATGEEKEGHKDGGVIEREKGKGGGKGYAEECRLEHEAIGRRKKEESKLENPARPPGMPGMIPGSPFRADWEWWKERSDESNGTLL